MDRPVVVVVCLPNERDIGQMSRDVGAEFVELTEEARTGCWWKKISPEMAWDRSLVVEFIKLRFTYIHPSLVHIVRLCNLSPGPEPWFRGVATIRLLDLRYFATFYCLSTFKRYLPEVNLDNTTTTEQHLNHYSDCGLRKMRRRWWWWMTDERTEMGSSSSSVVVVVWCDLPDVGWPWISQKQN